MSMELRGLADAQLLAALRALASDARRCTVRMLRLLAEVDRRRLALKEGYPSLFEFCRRELRYAEGEAARRIHAARAAARFPVLYRAIGRGLLSLTTASMLAPHLTWENHRRLVRSALGRSKREVEKLLAAESPAPEPPERVRFIGVAARPSSEPAPLFAAPGAPPAQTALPPSGTELVDAAPAPAAVAARVQFSFTAEESLLEAVEKAKGLLRHKFPFAGLEEVFTEALGALLEKLGPATARAEAGRPAPPEVRRARPRAAGSRHIPRRVKAAVRLRDGGRCSFVSPSGRRCGTADGLQFDHVQPWAMGGASDDPANLRLLCRAHNALQARLDFGDDAVDAAVRASRRQRKDPGLSPGVV